MFFTLLSKINLNFPNTCSCNSLFTRKHKLLPKLALEQRLGKSYTHDQCWACVRFQLFANRTRNRMRLGLFSVLPTARKKTATARNSPIFWGKPQNNRKISFLYQKIENKFPYVYYFTFSWTFDHHGSSLKI